MLAKDHFIGLWNFHYKFLSFYFIWHNLMLYLFNENLFEMMHLAWLLFYFGNVFNPLIILSPPFSLFITWWPLGFSFISFLLLWFTQFSYYLHEPSFNLIFFSNVVECFISTIYHMLTTEAYFYFILNLHNFHIILLNLLLFWNFFQMLLSLSYSLIITWWPLGINSISCLTFVIYTIFKCAFSYVIIVVTFNNDNMHWALATRFNLQFWIVITYLIVLSYFWPFSKSKIN
jgi:hypothetical protein